MSAYAGSLVPVTTPYVSLDRIPLVLLLGSLVIAFSRGLLEPRRRHSVALVSIGMALGLLAIHAAQLAMLDPARRALRDVTTNLVRIGSFDANLGFFLDPAATFLLLLPIVGSAFFLSQTKFVENNISTTVRFQSSVLLLNAGVSTALLADGFVALLMGLSLAIVATYLLILRDERLRNPVTTAGRVFMMQFVGSASFLAGFVLLFWGLGGAWHHDGYLADYHARFVAVHDHAARPEDVVAPDDVVRGERDAALVSRRAKERGSLTFTSHPGARVYVDVGDKNLDHMEPFATAPFVRKELPVGPHDVVIVPEGAAIVTGDGHEVAWIDRLMVGTGENVSIVTVGQTATFAEVQDQLGLVDDEGKHFLRNALFNNQVGESFSLISILVFLLGIGSLLVGTPVLALPWITRVASSSTWNLLRISAVVVALYPLVRFRALIEFHYGILAVLFVAAAVVIALVRARRASLVLGTATLAAATLFFAPTNAYASKDPIPQISMRPERGEIVELDYAPDGETMVGAFVIRNITSTPLTISGAHFVHSDAIPRLPPFVTVEIEGSKGQPVVVVEPGKVRRAIIRWQYGAARAREFYALAYAEPYVARVEDLVPVHAARSRDLGPWGDHVLSLIVWFPLLASALAIALRILRRDVPRSLAISSSLIFALELILIASVWFRFDKAFARADGNDGYQFIERFVIAPPPGVEYFLGIDGISLTLVILVSIAALLASIASLSLRDRALGFHVITPFLVSSALGVFLSLDMFLFCAFWFVGMIAATLLIANRGTPGARRAAQQLGAVSFAGMLFIIGATSWLHTHSDTAHLVDGRFVMSSLAIPELAHVNWVNDDATLFGMKGLVVVWSAFFVAFLLRLVTWGNVFAESDTPTNIVLPAALIGTGIHGLLRLNLGVMPHGTKWAATTIIVVGVLMIIVFAFMASFQTNMKRWIAHGATAYAGFVLIGLGSCTPQGIAATLHVAFSLTLAIALFAMLAQALEARVHTVDITRFRGLSDDMPLFAGMFLAAVFVMVGLPGLAGFWGPLLAVVGVVPRHLPLAMGAIVCIVIVGATQIQVAGRILFGAIDTKWRKSKELATLGGKFPDLWRDELFVMVPLAVLVVGLGLSPRTLFSVLDAVLLDLHRLVDAAGSMQVG